MPSTVLSPYSAGAFNNASLLARMSKVFEDMATQRTQQIENTFQSKVNSIELDAGRWKRIQGDIDNARGEIVDSYNRAKTVLRYVNDMIRDINKAEQNSGDSGFNAAGYAAALDSRMRTLNAKVQDARSPDINLLDKFETDFTFPVTPTGSNATVSGNFIGTDYYIVDSDNNRWQPDFQAKNLKQYSVYPDTPTSKVGNFATGLRVDSISGDTITFTVGPDTASPESFTGTMHRSGLKLMSSWYYDGLASSDGRTRALTDLGEAKEALTLEVNRYNTSLATTDFYSNIADTAIRGFRTETNDILLEQAAEVGKAQQELGAQYKNATGSIGQSLAMKNQYAKMMAPFIYSGYTKLFDLTA